MDRPALAVSRLGGCSSRDKTKFLIIPGHESGCRLQALKLASPNMRNRTLKFNLKLLAYYLPGQVYYGQVYYAAEVSDLLTTSTKRRSGIRHCQAYSAASASASGRLRKLPQCSLLGPDAHGEHWPRPPWRSSLNEVRTPRPGCSASRPRLETHDLT